MAHPITALKRLDLAELKILAKQSGPCITIQTPDYQKGNQQGNRREHIKTALQATSERLAALGIDRREQILKDLHSLVDSLDLDRGGPGITIVSTPDLKAAYETPGVSSEKASIGQHLCLKSFIASLPALEEFLILGIGRNCVRLFRYAYGRTEEMKLPPKVPANMAQALDLDQPDHDLQTRSYAGPSMGAMGGVYSGTETDREAGTRNFHKFSRVVDDALHETLRQTPVLLLGVREDLAEFRRAVQHARVFDTELHGNPEHQTLDEIARQTRVWASQHAQRQAEAALAEFVDLGPLLKMSGDITQILGAAASGRVRRLIVAEAAAAPAASSEFAHPGAVYVGEDLINAAVVETLRNSGEVFTLPGDALSTGGPAAAILRY